MNTACITALLIASISTLALADVYIEVDFASAGPNGDTEGNLVMGENPELAVWIWADEPGLVLQEMSLQITSLSALGIPDTGGAVTFDQLGTLDPNGNFAGYLSDPGVFNNNQSQITNITLLDLFGVGSSPLPTSIDEAWLLYSDFIPTVNEPLAGVMPIVDLLDFGFDNSPNLNIHTFGLFQTPTPSTLGMLGLASLGITKRQRS